MNLTETPADRAAAWSHELPQLLAVCGPLTAMSAAALLRAAGHIVTDEEVEQELASRLDVHESHDGWVSVLAIADGAVLTTLLTPQACQTGVIAAGGDLDLWARLAVLDGMPLRSGGSLRTVWPAPAAAAVPRDAFPGLAGPDGWLGEFEPGHIIGLRLSGGALDVIPADDLLDGQEHGRKFGQRLAALAEVCLSLCQLALAGYAGAADAGAADAGQGGDELRPIVPLDEVAMDLMCGHPGILSEPLPPLSALLPVLGFEVSQGHAGLPGAFWHPADVAGLKPDEITASVSGSTLLRSKFHGGQPGEWLADFWQMMAFGPGVVSRVADLAERSGVEPKVLAELRQSANTGQQQAIAALLAARASEAEDDADSAAQLATEAISLDRSLPLAFADAGEYAAARGHFRLADELLQLAGEPVDSGLRRGLQPLLRPPAAAATSGGTSRNRPCPCGSGRKYKTCCLAAAKAAAPLRDRAAARHASIMAYAQRAPSREVVRGLIGMEFAGSWLIARDLAVFDAGLADEYLRTRGHWMQGDERALVDTWRATPLAAYEVTQVRAGAGLSVRELPDGGPVWLADRRLSANAQRHDLLITRLFDCGDEPRILALPVRLSPRHRDAAIALLTGDGRVVAGPAEGPGAGRAYTPWQVMEFFESVVLAARLACGSRAGGGWDT